MKLPPDTDKPLTAAAKLLILAAAFVIALLVLYPPARKPAEAPKASPARIEPVPSADQRRLEELTERLTRMPRLPDARRFARAESGGNPRARNAHSSASGLLQFTDHTWSLAVARWGKTLHIRLRDKNKPSAQLAMAQKLAEDNARIMEKKLGRRPTEGEVYAAHVFGAHDAATLVEAARKTPNRKAVYLYPQYVVDANRGIFFDGKKARTVTKVCQLLTDKIG